ncbi:outer dense fiber protein 2-like isoform X1 [Esox lucius]|uniref:outer dense fiber protein 2-like isoform X1 n=1 Tax=Esox lucius TaxID=8010 RepID=UPI00147681F7|nr:outer dense fiber protein 2-like isoform X1 [Esox lucius]
MKTRDSSAPLHVHVPETLPVHIHLKRIQYCAIKKKEVKIKGDVENHAAARAQTRRDDAYKWELSDEDDQEQRKHGEANKYGRKIDRLMMDVGSPKNVLRLWKNKRLLDHPSEYPRACQRVINEGELMEEELLDQTKDLDLRGQDNILPRHSIRKLWETGHYRADLRILHGERDKLLRKLVEAEIDGTAVATQLTALNEAMGSTKKDKRLSEADAALLSRQQKLLKKKIETFDSTNRSLRELLRECNEREIELLKMSDPRQDLQKRLADTEAEIVCLTAKLKNKEKETTQLAKHLNSEKENVKTTVELCKVLECYSSQLIVQLSNKETENDRQAVQIQEMEQTQDHQQEKIQALLEELEDLKQHSKKVKETLKQASQTLRHRAKRSEDSARQLSSQLLEKETDLAEALSSADSWCTRHSKEGTLKSQLQVEITRLRNHVTELTALIHTVKEKGCADTEGLLEQLHRLTSDNYTNKLDNQRLKTTLSAAKENLTQSQSEAQQLKSLVNKLEDWVENYKSKSDYVQVQVACLESEEYRLKVEISEKNARENKADLERETKQVRSELLGRLKELEPLSGRMKCSEWLLREAQGQIRTQERRIAEQNNALSELRYKVEQQGCLMETFQKKNLLLLEENQNFQQKIESIERELEQANMQNRGMVQETGKREEIIQNTQKQLEARDRESWSLSMQLEQALKDGQEQCLEWASVKDRSIQVSALNLESQLKLSKTELIQLRRSKEDMQLRFQNQLKNIKERLEQSKSTNLSLINYVTFLKTTYSNVFGDAVLSSYLNTSTNTHQSD